MAWTQSYAELGNSIVLTSIAVVIPIVYLFWALAIKRMKGHVAGISTLVLTVIDVILVYKMPVSIALSATALGIIQGLFPIAWIVFSAVFLYNLVVEAGQFDVIKSSIASISDDRRIQALLVAFCFGAFMEGAAGFGAPVAIAGAIMIGLGFEPLMAAGLCLVANTAPVAFGGIGSPIIAAGAVSGLGADVVSAAVGRQLPFISIIIPFYLIYIMVGWKKTKEVIPVILVTGITFAIAQYLSSNFLGAYLPDIISSLASLIAIAVFLKFWQPKTKFVFETDKNIANTKYSGGQIFKAWSPFVVLVVLVGLWGTPSFKSFVTHKLQWFVNIPHWPGLDGLVYKAAPIVSKPTVYSASYKWDFFLAGGTAMLFTAIITMLILGISPTRGIQTFGRTFKQLSSPIIMIGAVLGIAYLANYSGMSYTLGLLFASTGHAFAFISPFLGWLGVFLTGSDTSSNALFAKLQMVTANQLNINPVLAVAANSSGGVMGKMISPQNLAVGAAATGLVGREGELFRFTFKHSIRFIIVVGIMVFIQAYVVPGMMPHVPVTLAQ